MPYDSRLAALGYSEAFARHLAEVGGDRTALEPARVVFTSRERCRLAGARGEAWAVARRWIDRPVIGDWVAVEPGTDPVTVHAVLPRRTQLSRKVAGDRVVEQVVAANVDTVFVVMGLDRDYNLRRLERFAVMVEESGADLVVVLTKADLSSDPSGARLDALAVAAGAPVYVISALRGDGLDPVRALVEPGRTVALVGSSGAGKSTLLNRLCDAPVMRTAPVRPGDGRGRHTTTHRELVSLPGGGLLVDNPGVREIQLWAEPEALDTVFQEIDHLARRCRFRDCDHDGEPGCAVAAAIEAGALDPARLESRRALERELQHLEQKRSTAASRQADRRLGRMYKRVQAAKLDRHRPS